MIRLRCKYTWLWPKHRKIAPRKHFLPPTVRSETVKPYVAASRISQISLRAGDAHQPIPNPPRAGSKTPAISRPFRPKSTSAKHPAPVARPHRIEAAAHLDADEPKHPPAPAAGRCPGLHVRSRRPQRPAAPIHGPARDAAAASLRLIVPRKNPNPSPPSRPRLVAPRRLELWAHRASSRPPPRDPRPERERNPRRGSPGGRPLQRIEAARNA